MSGSQALKPLKMSLSVAGIKVEAEGENVLDLKKRITLTLYREQLKRVSRPGQAVLDTAIFLNISERTVYNYLQEEYQKRVQQSHWRKH